MQLPPSCKRLFHLLKSAQLSTVSCIHLSTIFNSLTTSLIFFLIIALEVKGATWKKNEIGSLLIKCKSSSRFTDSYCVYMFNYIPNSPLFFILIRNQGSYTNGQPKHSYRWQTNTISIYYHAASQTRNHNNKDSKTTRTIILTSMKKKQEPTEEGHLNKIKPFKLSCHFLKIA